MIKTTKIVNGVKTVRRYADFTRREKLIVWLHHISRRCTYCHWRSAIWSYMPGWENACDHCVPRGCSCNDDLKDGIAWDSPEAAKPENWTTPTDEKGRQYPCCEWYLNR